MKFHCAKNDLLNALSIATRALANKTNTPILSGIYMKAANDGLEIQANNNEIGIVTRIEADVQDQGELVLPGKYLQEVSRRLPGEDVSFEFSQENGIVNIVSEKAKFSLKNLNASEFPLVTRLEGETTFSLPNNSLLKLIKRTYFSCATGEFGEARPIFSGCYLTSAEQELIMVATNTHRLSLETETIEAPLAELKMIIPAKVLAELTYIIDSDVPVEVKINCTDKKIGFECENTYIVSRLIEGNFPEYQKVIPKSIATVATVNTKEFSDAVNRVALISRSNDYNTIRLVFAENQVHISSTNPDIGNADEYVPLQLEGLDVDISFNVTYLIDVLKVIDGDTCVLHLNRPLEPIMVKDSDDEGFTYILTPVRTSN